MADQGLQVEEDVSHQLGHSLVLELKLVVSFLSALETIQDGDKGIDQGGSELLDLLDLLLWCVRIDLL